nr:type II secretion system major pseudopilin GspG [Paraburkholderia sp. ZP32-5]
MMTTFMNPAQPRYIARRNAEAQSGKRDSKRYGKRDGQRGFTLIEIMVVIAILGILAALIVPKIMSRPDEARRVAAKQDIGSIMQAMNLYRLDNGRYPTQDQGLRALVEKPATDPVPNNWKDGGYLERLPVDPWGNPYQYLSPGTHGDIDIFSFGADGKAGGEANDADIGSWQ